jgi:hypothetical protein
MAGEVGTVGGVRATVVDQNGSGALVEGVEGAAASWQMGVEM